MRKKALSQRWEQHMSESERDSRSARTRIVILGGGFGGLATALRLEKELGAAEDVSILVIDRDNDLLFTPLLWTVAAGRTNPNDVIVPIRDFQKGRRFHVLHAEVEQIELEQKIVHTSAGARPYDILVIALGSNTVVPNLPGLRELALGFRTPADALQLRNHLIDAIEAAHHTDDPVQQQAWLTFVVGGAGDTGVELAAIIQDYLMAGLFDEYPWLVEAPIRVIVVGRAERLLPMSEPATTKVVERVLQKEGIEVLTRTSITGVTRTSVQTSRGSIAARTLFWAAGITAPEVVRRLGVSHAANGAVMVDDFLNIPGYGNVYVIGDSAWAYDSVNGHAVPPTAQAARQQGEYVGKTIAIRYMGGHAYPYRYVTLGHLALLGHHTAVARIGSWTLYGPAIWLLWHLVYLWRNPSWSKRIRLVVDWLLSAMLGRETGQLRLLSGLPQHDKVLETA
ncbi:MAG: NAD(P)/FAD-dependent oxidoreductase [Chloroflexi bacterium]|nr:MAG: NAD(P)/FAD-dependent oxidoreductase [Chloroflexota bacterium]